MRQRHKIQGSITERRGERRECFQEIMLTNRTALMKLGHVHVLRARLRHLGMSYFL